MRESVEVSPTVLPAHASLPLPAALPFWSHDFSVTMPAGFSVLLYEQGSRPRCGLDSSTPPAGPPSEFAAFQTTSVYFRPSVRPPVELPFVLACMAR